MGANEMKCVVCKKETEIYTIQDAAVICAECMRDYLKWKLKRSKLDNSIKTFARKHKKCS